MLRLIPFLVGLLNVGKVFAFKESIYWGTKITESIKKIVRNAKMNIST